MSNFNKFMKENKIKKSNTTYAATKSLVDENGKPLLWTIRAITTAENDIIREECTNDVQVTGKPNIFRPKINTPKYIAKMICAAIVEPNLNNKELQDSYGVMSAEDLLKEMIDNPGEYADLAAFVQEFNGFDVSFEEKVEKVKN